MRRKKSTEERFLSKVAGRDNPDGCWKWTGGLSWKGYGSFNGEGFRHVSAHRFAYQLWVGKIPDGLVIDHLCRTRSCVNPAHMEPVTSAENTRRGIGNQNVGKYLCPKGHEYDTANTYRDATGRRHCRTCRRIKAYEAYQSRRHLKWEGKGAPGLKTHCPRGHTYDEKNTRIDKRGFKNCRECHRLKNIRQRLAKSQERALSHV